jgi:hypothetical protein
MRHFEPYIPLSVSYPITVSLIMADPLAPFINALPRNVGETVRAADDAAQDGLATNYPVADRQIKFLAEKANDVVRVSLSPTFPGLNLRRLTSSLISRTLSKSLSSASIFLLLSTSAVNTPRCISALRRTLSSCMMFMRRSSQFVVDLLGRLPRLCLCLLVVPLSCRRRMVARCVIHLWRFASL